MPWAQTATLRMFAKCLRPNFHQIPLFFKHVVRPSRWSVQPISSMISSFSLANLLLVLPPQSSTRMRKLMLWLPPSSEFFPLFEKLFYAKISLREALLAVIEVYAGMCSLVAQAQCFFPLQARATSHRSRREF